MDVGSNITLLSMPTLESIQEFKIITSSYSAEWPRSGGGIVNVVTRGGTQKFTGTAYEFVRNDKLNANSYFRNFNSNPDISGKPPRLRYNNFGYTVGGPMLPSRQKAFFFFSQEWRRISRAPSSSTATVVNPAWLNDPTNANYVAPENRDPNAVKLLALWPAANSGVNQFLNTNPNVNNTRQEVVRIDYDINPNWKLLGRYTHDLSQTVEPSGIFSLGVAVPNVGATATDVPGNVFVTELRTVVGRGLNEFKYQLSGNLIETRDPEGNRNTRDELEISIPELFPENNANRIPNVNVSGAISSIASVQGYHIEYINHTFADNFTYPRGSHTYKFGMMMAFEQKNENASNTTRRARSCSTPAAGGRRSRISSPATATDCAARRCTYSEAEIDVTNHLRFNRYEMFAQDTWRLTPNVTLDYGVRYAIYPALIDTNDILSTFVPEEWNPAQAPTFANAAGSALVPGTGESGQRPDRRGHQFAVRPQDLRNRYEQHHAAHRRCPGIRSATGARSSGQGTACTTISRSSGSSSRTRS